jgi:hypothetical protein
MIPIIYLLLPEAPCFTRHHRLAKLAYKKKAATAPPRARTALAATATAAPVGTGGVAVVVGTVPLPATVVEMTVVGTGA